MKSPNHHAQTGHTAALKLAIAAGAAVLLTACVNPPVARMYSQDKLAEAVRVPTGNTVALETTAVGTLNYECRANPATAGAPGWVLVSPSAELFDRAGQRVGSYSGPPATWTLTDGSSVVGAQLAVAPVVGAIHLPLQLSKGTPGAASGMLQNVTYIQRVNTKNGLDFVSACTSAEVGAKVTRPYQADYIFWKAA